MIVTVKTAWIKVYADDILSVHDTSDIHDGSVLELSDWEAKGRHPNREEARQAARTLMACNGYDLDVWTDNEWQPDTGFLRNLAK